MLVLPEEGPWTVRVVPNLYPALERQEVVVHSPRHVRSFAELEDAELELVAQAWRERFAAAGAAGFPYVHAMVNEGRYAGASLAHSHSQLVWLREPPPAVTGEQADGDCAVCRLLEPERHADRRQSRARYSHSRIRPRAFRAADRGARTSPSPRTRSPTCSGS